MKVENSIPSVDFRNGRDTIKIRHDRYDARYENITHEKHPVKEKLKRNVKVFCATRRVATCTVRKLKAKLLTEHGLNVSLGAISYLKPFYITNPTEKEKVLCMCKLCLNYRNKFTAMMAHSKEHNGPYYDSISKYYIFYR